MNPELKYEPQIYDLGKNMDSVANKVNSQEYTGIWYLAAPHLKHTVLLGDYKNHVCFAWDD